MSAVTPPRDDIEAQGSLIVAWDETYGMPQQPNPGVIRLAGVDWLDEAACVGHPSADAWLLDPSVDELTPEELNAVVVARRVCRACGVSDECRALADETEVTPTGIWAGLTWAERGGEAFPPDTEEAVRKRTERAAETPEARAERNRRNRERMARTRRTRSIPLT